MFDVRGLPDGSLIYGQRRNGVLETVFDRPGEPPKVLALKAGSGVTYARSGHLLYAGRETPGIWAVPFDLARGELTGEPFRGGRRRSRPERRR